jgi:chromosome segregation ATPase
LQYELEEERRMKKNLEIEHASELNTLQSEHAAEVDRLDHIIEQERQTVTDTKNEQLELHRRLEQLREDLSAIKDKLETERTAHEEQLSQLQTEIEEKEKATDQIKILQQQTRNMVKRAQEDWESKNEELKSIKQEQEAVDSAVRDLLYRFRPSDPSLKDYSLDKYIKSFKENLETFEKEYDMTKENLNAITQELVEVTELNTNLIDAHNERRSIASGMAEQLEEYRRNVIFEIVNQLQLPMDEEELKVLQTKVTPSDDDTAIWNQILQLCSSINTQKFVLRVNKRVRDNYDLAKQYKKEYRSIKGNIQSVSNPRNVFILTCITFLYESLLLIIQC